MTDEPTSAMAPNASPTAADEMQRLLGVVQEQQSEIDRLRAELAERDGQEPVAYLVEPEKFVPRAVEYLGSAGVLARSWGGRFSPLYKAPPSPRPAVPEAQRELPNASAAHVGFVRGWNACRDAMLTSAPTPPADGEARKKERQVGCERDDGLLNIHGGSETCEVCAPADASGNGREAWRPSFEQLVEWAKGWREYDVPDTATTEERIIYGICRGIDAGLAALAEKGGDGDE